MTPSITSRRPDRRAPRQGRGTWRGRTTGAVLAGVLLLGGCTEFPDMNGRLDEADAAQPYPALVPVEGLLAGTQAPAIRPETQARLEDRVAALERRAAALRDSGLDPETRARMQAGVAPLQP